jgi:death on curing protein
VTWTWLRLDAMLAVHEEQLAEHGGTPGIRDIGLLESALARPKNLAAYGDHEPDAVTLAASYAIAIIRNHPFVDGNKRVGLIAAELFLALHGYELVADDADCVVTFLKLASGEITDEGFTEWLRSNSSRPYDESIA